MHKEFSKCRLLHIVDGIFKVGRGWGVVYFAQSNNLTKVNCFRKIQMCSCLLT